MIYSVKYKGREYKVHGHGSEEYISSYLARGQFYEEPLLTYIHKNYPNIGRVVDCGANIGNHTVFFRDVMGCEVWSFEPQPDNFRLLKKNSEQSYKVALGKSSGKASTTTNLLNMGMSEVVDGEGVTVTVLDNYKLQPDLIKIDVEGMEVEVLKGAFTTIDKYRPVLVVEHNDIQKVYETARILEPYNYKLTVFPTKTWEMFIYEPS